MSDATPQYGATPTAGTTSMAEVTTLADLVAGVAQRNGASPALICGDETWDYARLDRAIELAADGLAARGVRHGDRVALMAPNIPPFVIAYYAILRLGAIVVPINVLYKADEIAHMLQDSEAGTLIVFADFHGQVAAAVKEAPSVKEIIVVGTGEPAPDAYPPGATSWSALLDGSAPPRPPATIVPEDIAVICYTSGTTGRSKGAMLTHRNFLANCEQMQSLDSFRLRPEDITCLVLPLFHIYAMNVGMNATLRAGATVLLIPRFEAVPVLEALQKHRCTIFLGAPPMFVAWVNTPSLGDYDLSALRALYSGAAALPVQVLTRFADVTGVQIQEGYGLTETSPVTHSNAAGPVVKPGTIGPPIAGVEVRLVDDEDNDVPPGAEGEIVVRGANVTMGYWRNPAATAEALRGGWFHTGDIATVDEDGYFTIVDRKKDMINAGGFKVWPREVEELLYRHPAVREAAVVPMPDPYAGERPLAYVALRAGEVATAEEIIGYCREHLAGYKAPARVEFRDELPKLPTGKVLRRLLREEAHQEPSAGRR